MPQPIVVSTLQNEDKDIVKELLIDSYSQYEEVFRSPEAWENYLQNIKSSLDNPNVEQILVAKQGQNILGSIQFFESGEKAYQRPELDIQHPVVRLLAVHPNARGLGVAQILLRESLDIAASRGASYLYLHTGDIMEKARALYEWLGFKRDQKNEFSNGNSLVRCYYFDLSEEREHIAGTRATTHLDSKTSAPVSGTLERRI
ncbi:GNAT family N-acetyltransferase [Alkalicoccobacillus murimartini]|uniref:Ribosomal protein S18 acetylase RimI-like enzyme n=1 Tax=Alkalicoccobacillus murimartini TaxID=171685 RepID=A0ABT9YFC1_9BACI|nr:GNAT family N-acetyltransferase [Alkalicoccobacillus murimartini]MDQ0206541.1 ribosomal protein S18 acetylase RimI-like enzyme [Alkalicoccobacillus murimartini]